jgi:hypothetical protein
MDHHAPGAHPELRTNSPLHLPRGRCGLWVRPFVRFRHRVRQRCRAVALHGGGTGARVFGILLLNWLAVRAGLARLPRGVNWPVMLGAGCLAGIGFTMSLIISGMALDGAVVDAGKIGTLTGSALSTVLGSFLLLAALPRSTAAEDGPEIAPAGEAPVSTAQPS